MDTINLHHEAIAAFIARVFLGLLFFFQGYDAIFNVKVKYVIQAYENSFANKGIPRILTVCGAWFTSYVELIGGILLILGLFEYYALYFLGIDLIIASIGFGITTAMWDMRYVFPRLALLLFFFFFSTTWHLWSIDQLILNVK